MRDHYLYLDCETIPSQSPAILDEIAERYQVPEVDLDAIKPAANLTDPAKIAADIEKRRAKAIEDREAALEKRDQQRDADYRKLCFDGATAHLAAVSFALDDGVGYQFHNDALEALMRYLCRLVTPPGGIVLDPFAGSGTTLVAAHEEGFKVIGCEREDEYVADICRRFNFELPGKAGVNGR